MSEQWNQKIQQNPDHGDLLQSEQFAQIKASNGWKSRQLEVELADKTIFVLALIKNIPLLGEFWYIPKGPGIIDRADFFPICQKLKSLAPKSFVIKIEPKVPALIPADTDHTDNSNYVSQEQFSKQLEQAKIIPTKPIQANWNTVIIDLTKSEDELLASFRQRARRALRDADEAKISFEVSDNSLADFKQFYKLYQQTAERAGFALRSFDYFLEFWQTFTNAGMGQLFFVKGADSVRSAGAFIIYNQLEALYKDGASDRTGAHSGAAHYLQFQIMLWLKAKGIKFYDLHGTPPATELENNKHPLYSLGIFKTSFGQTITSTIGAFDIILNNKKYQIWLRYYQKAYQKYLWRIKKKILF